jgi:ABC-type multidrug transport system fused ATPase/permease subunit
MHNDIDRLKRIVAKTLRKAKQWYLWYVICQVIVLGLAVAAVLANFDPRVSAVLAFIAILGTECIRWRSDFWKSQGEFAKRRWEVADGLGETVDNVAVADWLAAKPHTFLDNVNERELAGSTFESTLPPGPDRVIENTEESAWWSKHESRLMIWYLSAALVVLLIGVFVALSISIGGLSDANAATTRVIAQNVGAVICAVLTFVFSISVVRLLASFVAFLVSAKTIAARCRDLLRTGSVDERTAVLLLFDYQTARDGAPLLPTFLWRIHGGHLRSEWRHYRSKR